ncbi:histidine kinase [Streptomyces sp. RFCAC02]|uniref:sensor histidine kinase n=1 Tax=Streptomyces sp. RFCAC02 TaxID=2499143 RepID=UPI00143CEB64|nr:histidine kinase [Streptomyces sp. RFCAC02]
MHAWHPRTSLPPAAAVAADTLMVALAASPGPLATGAFAVAAAGAALAGRWWPWAAFAGASALPPLTGAGYVLLLWSAYRAGRSLGSRGDAARVAGAAAGGFALHLLAGERHMAGGPGTVGQLVMAHLVFVALPLLAGRYLAQHRHLLDALAERNRRLTAERALLAERERLRERLRIAREMHDSLGHRLALVSVQAAALEVAADLPAAHRDAVRGLAGATRDALTELQDLVGQLRTGAPQGDGGARPVPDVAAVERLVARFRRAAAGRPVVLHRSGAPVPLSPEAWRAAYAVVEEGLTNAAKHAPGRPVAVSLTWERDALLVAVENPGEPSPDAAGGGGGHGLRGLAERVEGAGGMLDHRRAATGFRLFALLPAAPPAPQAGDGPAVPGADAGPLRMALSGLAVAALVLVVLPAGLLMGTGGR